MLELSRYFSVPFDEPEISAEELRRFAEDHFAKLSSAVAMAPDHACATLLKPTQGTFAAFDGALTARAEALATREGGTLDKDDVVRLFRTLVRQREGRVKDRFGKPSPAYEEFFPRGLGEYTRATVGRLQTLLDRVVEKAEKHRAELGPEMAAEFTDLRKRFTEARGGQMDGSGSLTTARTLVAETRRALEKQLEINVLTLALHHAGHPERAKDYFDQSLLEDPTQQNEEPPPVTPPPAGS